MIKKSVLSAAILTALASTSAIAEDTNESAHNLTLEVPRVALIDMHDGTNCILVAPTEAGQNFTPGSTNGYTYDITANKQGETSRALQAKLSANITLGVDLKVNVTAPSGATSLTDTSLNLTAQDVVTGIQNIVQSSLPVSYHCANNTESIPDYGSQTLEIQYTLTDDS